MDRSLLTLTRTSGMPVYTGLFCVGAGLFRQIRRPLLTEAHTHTAHRSDAAGVKRDRCAISTLMRGSVVVEAVIRPDTTGADYRSPPALAAIVSRCVADRATALCSFFRAKRVELVKGSDSWWRTAQQLSRDPATRARKKEHAGHGAPATVRMRFADVFFDRLQDFGGIHGSFGDAGNVGQFQRQLAKELASILNDAHPARFKVGWPQPLASLSVGRNGERAARGAVDGDDDEPAALGGISCDVDIMPVASAARRKGDGVGGAGMARGKEDAVSKTPAHVADELIDKAVSRDLQTAASAALCARVESVEGRPLSHGHARYCQELFDHYKHPRTGKLVHG